MRSLEVLTLVVTFAAFLVPARARTPAALVALAFTLLHVAVEGARWQMVPAYAVVAALVAFRLLGGPWPRAVGIAARGMGFAALGFAAVLAYTFPIYELPAPGGPAAVGTRTLLFEDATRDEPFTADPADRRALEVQVWYPAVAETGAATAPYLTNARDGLRGSARLVGLPSFFFDHMLLYPTSSALDAPLAPGARLPVLVFSHGYALGHVGQNTWLMQELASRGYAVFSISHPGEAMSSQLSRTEAIPLDPDQPLFRAAWDEASSDDLESGDKTIMNKSMDRWVADTVFALDELERLDAAGHFAGRLDLDRIGLFGMSFGGATAARVCTLDARCKAGANLDGYHYGTALGRPLPRPFLMLYSESNVGMNRSLLADALGSLYTVQITGSTHAHFSELVLQASLLTSFMTPPESGEMIDGWRALELVNELVIEFFGHELRGEPAPLLERTRSHPELRFLDR